jgi:hypothetical protein
MAVCADCTLEEVKSNPYAKFKIFNVPVEKNGPMEMRVDDKNT